MPEKLRIGSQLIATGDPRGKLLELVRARRGELDELERRPTER